MGLIIYNRDGKGVIDKNHHTYTESQKEVDNQLQELLEGTKLLEDIGTLQSNDLSTQLALVEVYEMVLALTQPKTTSEK